MQRDAFERLDLKRMLAEPETLEAVQPDVSLVSTLISMRALLGGGTDINRAVGYCAQRITRPENTVLVLISDLYEGGVEVGLLAQAQRLVASGVQMVALLALSDEGAPAYDRRLAARLAALGVPAFACTPDRFPEMMAAAIRKQDLAAWAAGAGIAAVPADAGAR